jgi:hypothetical protein
MGEGRGHGRLVLAEVFVPVGVCGLCMCSKWQKKY